MITVTHDGVEYTKATEVAKKFGYTSDYLGQLCRAKKVNARLVGRSWFIDVSSLETHRSNKYANKRKAEPTEPVKQTEERSTFEERLEEVQQEQKTDISSKKYLRRVAPPKARVREINTYDTNQAVSNHVAIQYEEDEQSLIPKVESAPQVKLLKVSPAGAESLKVTSAAKKSQLFAPEPIPEVSLSGKLSVTAISDLEDEVAEGQQEDTEDISNTRDNVKNKVKVVDKEKRGAYKVEVHTRAESFRQKLETAEKSEKATDMVKVVKSEIAEKKLQVAQKPDIPVKIASEIQPAHDLAVHKQEIPVVDPDAEELPQSIRIEVPAFAVISGVLLAVAILSLEQVTIVSTEGSTNTLEFVWRNVVQMAAILFTST